MTSTPAPSTPPVGAQPPAGPAPDETPKEPKLVVDFSGSMKQSSTGRPEDMTKYQLTTEIAEILVTTLGAEDTAGKDEAGSPGDKFDETEGGGLFTIGFSDTVTEIGDLNQANFRKLWNALHPEGGTYITPALQAALDDYNEEFGKKPDALKPLCLLTVITDGEPNDLNAATQWLSTNAKDHIHVFVFIVGHGDAHDKCLAAWGKLAQSNHNIQVTSLSGIVDAQAAASKILAAVE